MHPATCGLVRDVMQKPRFSSAKEWPPFVWHADMKGAPPPKLPTTAGCPGAFGVSLSALWNLREGRGGVLGSQANQRCPPVER